MKNRPDISPTFCVTPWNHLATSARGHLRVCCIGVPEHNYLRNSDGQRISAAEVGDFERVWNSSQMKELRQQMKLGHPPELCRYCLTEEKSGGVSLRVNRNSSHKHMIPTITAETNPDGSAPPRVSSLDLRFGNRCNLGCRMCNPYASRYLLGDWPALFPEELSPKDVAELKSTDWFDQPRAWDLFFSVLPGVDRIYLTGGEPMLAKAQFLLLKRCVDEGYASKITIEYNINVTILDEELISYWKHFKEVRLYLSIDGIGDLNEYIRYPSKWPTIESNLEKLEELAADYGNMYLAFSVTVQAYNILRLTEIFDYLKSSQFKQIQPRPLFNVLNQPTHFHCCVLPSNLRVLAAERLQSYYSADSNSTPAERQFQKQLRGVVSRLETLDFHSHWEEFNRVTKIFDQRRSQDLTKIVPELHL